MLLKNRKTDLKSLKYGKDRPGGGSSNQPYIKSKIPSGEINSNFLSGPDFLLRGGSLVGKRIEDDVSRISSIMFDTRSPQGLLFTAKQSALQRQSSSMGGKSQGLFENAYLPITPTLQAAGTPMGLHLNGKGNPISGLFGEGAKGNLSFISKIDGLNMPTTYSNTVDKKDKTSPLIGYINAHMLSHKTGNGLETLYKYSGGSGSTLGIGETRIKLGERTGLSNDNIKAYIDEINSSKKAPILESIGKKLKPNWVTSPKLEDKLKIQSENYTDKGKGNKEFTEQSQDKSLQKPFIKNPKIEEFLLPNKDERTFTNLNSKGQIPTLKPNWIPSLPTNPMEGGIIKGKNSRINLNSTKPKKGEKTGGVDKITMLPIYNSSVPDYASKLKEGNDLIKFRIAVIDNDLTDGKVTQNNIHFRAYLDSFSDSYGAEWQNYQFAGRGEKFHRYSGFTRDINMSWTVAALSHKELIPMYKKLNYLASSLSPSYSNNGYMRGNLVKLSVGAYLYEQVGILHSLTYTVPNESPWEINVKNDYVNGTEQENLRELPHMIKVTGVKFTPIHNFRPEVATIDKNKSKFIALKNKNGDLW